MKQDRPFYPPSLHALSGKAALQVLHGAGEGIVVIDERNRIVFFNAMAEKLWGYTQADVIGKNVSMLLPVSLRDGHDAFVERNRSTGVNTIIGTSRPITLETRVGEAVAAELALSMIEIGPDGRKYYLATIRGLTEESHRNTLAGLQNTVFRALSTDMTVANIAGFMCRELETYLPDMVATLLVVDDARQLRILSGAGVPGRYAKALEGITLSAHDSALLAHEPAQATGVVWGRCRSLGIALGLHDCRAMAILSPVGHVTGILALFSRRQDQQADDWPGRTVSDCAAFCGALIGQYEARRRIARQADYDPLTGFLTRAALCNVLDAQIDQPGDLHIAVLVLNIDHFRDINEAFGYGNGDLFLKALATRMRALCRDTSVLARLGGDGFVIVLPRTPRDGAIAFVETLLDALRQPVDIDGSHVVPSLSVGISLFPDAGPDSETLLDRAEGAMRAARRQARGTYAVAPPHAPGPALRASMAGGGLGLHYQPQLCTRTGALYGVEALARWRHPRLGDILPARYMRIAENTGQLEAIGLWSLEEACRQIVAWERADIHVPRVAVNLCAAHLCNTGLPGALAGMLARYRLEAHRLTVELTESIGMDENPDMMTVLHAIRTLGVGLSMDDFGIGFSSLSRLARLPLAQIKIDRSIIMKLHDDVHAQALAKAMTGMGTMLGMTVIAEGVETEPQKALLEQLRCDVMQGYLFSRPLPPDDMGTWMADRKKD